MTMFRWKSVPNNALRFILVITVLFISGQSVSADPGKGKGVTTAHIISRAPIQGNDMSASRQRAIDSSLEAAVSQTLLDLISEERAVSNFQLIGDTVFNQTDQFVRDYKVLTESTHGKTYRVLVQATISMDRLSSVLADAGITRDPHKKLRVLMCVAEKNASDLNYQYWWGGPAPIESTVAPLTIAKRLEEAGIDVISGNMAISGGETYPLRLSVEQAVALAGRMKANVVVIGRAMAEEAPNTMGSAMKSFRGIIEMNAYLVDGGKHIAHVEDNKLVASADLYQGSRQALANAADLAGETLAGELRDAWMGMGSGTAALEMIIEGTGGHIANFVQFRGALGTISGVDSLQLKEMRPDSAILSVVYQGNSRTLAEALLLQSFETFGINIIETGSRYIRLQLIPH
jgi:hypothetical protein